MARTDSLAEPLRTAVRLVLKDAGLTEEQAVGSTFRTYQEQVQARINNNCPDIYNSPASACSPDTARPGTSQHEIGLAIDVKQNETALSAFETYGPSRGLVRTVPSERWHWEHKDARSGSARAKELRAALAQGQAPSSAPGGTGGPQFYNSPGTPADTSGGGGGGGWSVLLNPRTWLRVLMVIAGLVIAANGARVIMKDLT